MSKCWFEDPSRESLHIRGPSVSSGSETQVQIRAQGLCEEGLFPDQEDACSEPLVSRQLFLVFRIFVVLRNNFVDGQI